MSASPAADCALCHPAMNVLNALLCLDGLFLEMLRTLGLAEALRLRRTSPLLLGALSHDQLRRAASGCFPALPLAELIRTTEVFGDDIAAAVLASDVATLNAAENDGCTALAWAASRRSGAPLCALLLAGGADVAKADSTGWTALFRAAWHGCDRNAALLLRAKADVGDQRARYTPLMAAARFGHTAAVRELLRAGADDSVTTPFGETALSLARDLRHEGAVRMLSGGPDGLDCSDAELDGLDSAFPQRHLHASRGRCDSCGSSSSRGSGSGRSRHTCKKARAEFEAALREEFC